MTTMPTGWIIQRRRSAELKVFNLAAAWKLPIEKAMAAFNNEGFGVTLTNAETETGADIVVKLAKGADKYPSEGTRHDQQAVTSQRFKADALHGQCTTFTLVNDKKKTFEVVFAVIFLPGAVSNVTNEQKEIIVIHEFIHAAGLDGGRPDGSKDTVGQDHDVVGLFVANLERSGKGLIEKLPEKGATAMPPLRIGGQTRRKVQTIWAKEG